MRVTLDAFGRRAELMYRDHSAIHLLEPMAISCADPTL